MSEVDRGIGEQKDGRKLSPPQTHKLAEAPQSESQHISGRTCSKVLVVKSVQTEPATVSIGTNTYTVSFDEKAPTVKEFLPYRIMDNSEFTWSQAHDEKNIRLDCPVFNARCATIIMHDAKNITSATSFQSDGSFRWEPGIVSNQKHSGSTGRGRGWALWRTDSDRQDPSMPLRSGCADSSQDVPSSVPHHSRSAVLEGAHADSGACLETGPFDWGPRYRGQWVYAWSIQVWCPIIQRCRGCCNA